MKIEILLCGLRACLRGARLSKDGNMWCVLRGANLMEGVAGFGATPSDAIEAFDLEERSAA